jgi:putative dehydrogenase
MSAADKAAVIGLGSMGFGMARSLLRAGFDVAGFDVSADSLARFAEAGGRAATTPADAARGATIVIAVVVNAAQTEAVLFGDNGCAAVMEAGSVFVSSATMAPDVARRLAARLEAMGPHYLDAPMSGGAARAEEGQLTMLASGSRGGGFRPPAPGARCDDGDTL